MIEGPWDAKFEPLLRKSLQFLHADRAITADLDLVAMGLDSMAAVELLLLLEEVYSVNIPDDLITAQTFATPLALWKAVETARET